MKNIAIIGSGSFGCALANHLANKNNIVKVWSYKEEEANIINNEHRCMFLKDSILNESIKCYTSYEETIKDSEYIFLVTPSKVIRETCKNIKKYVTNQKIIIASKGLEDGTNKLLSGVVKEELINVPVGILTGPSHAEEVIREFPTNVVFASIDNDFAFKIRELFNDSHFSVEVSNDVIGAEVGGSMKNIIALASGILSGLGYSSNIESALITKGLNEIKNIGISMGAEEETFYGLSGLGDLIVTCMSNNSRNKRAGILISKGKNLDEIKNEIGMIIEGLDNLNVAKDLIDKYDINCPIITALYSIIYENRKVETLLESVLK